MLEVLYRPLRHTEFHLLTLPLSLAVSGRAWQGREFYSHAPRRAASREVGRAGVSTGPGTPGPQPGIFCPGMKGQGRAGAQKRALSEAAAMEGNAAMLKPEGKSRQGLLYASFSLILWSPI